MLLTCVALLLCGEEWCLSRGPKERRKIHADLQSGTGLSLVTVYIRYLCSESCKVV